MMRRNAFDHSAIIAGSRRGRSVRKRDRAAPMSLRGLACALSGPPPKRRRNAHQPLEGAAEAASES